MVPPGAGFIALVFALFKIQAIPIMIDPGMGLGRMLKCIQRSNIDAMVAVPKAHLLRRLKPSSFNQAGVFVNVGRHFPGSGHALHRLSNNAGDSFDIPTTDSDQTAAILFTSGSTGPAKGVIYTHAMFKAQVEMIQRAYGMAPGEVDVPTFPLFGLFSVAMGVTVVIPDMDPSHPARANPSKIVEAIHQFSATNTFGSPALWRRVAAYCVDQNVSLPTLKRVLIAGASVPWETMAQLRSVLNDDALIHTPYGATEALPVASVSDRELAGKLTDATHRGHGICVGHPLAENDVRIIRIVDSPIPSWSDDLLVADGTIGEIVVAGPTVTHKYDKHDEANAAAKIRDGHRILHRMGDVGYRDGDGRIWFCGRKSQRVETAQGTLFTDQCEAVINTHPKVRRCALVGIGQRGNQQPVLVVELCTARLGRGSCGSELIQEIKTLAAAHEITKTIDSILFYPSLPVDVRHNAKINRELLAAWAARQLP